MKTRGPAKFTAVLLLICACVVPCVASARPKRVRQDGVRVPRFEDYPAREVYRGPVARVRLDSRRARMFRTRLREDSRGGANFAGHYVVVIWGCGTGCGQMGVVDARTGRVYFPPVEYMDIPAAENEEAHAQWFRLDSRLIRITRDYYDGTGRYTAYYYLFDNNRFRLLRKTEEKQPQPAEEPEN